MSFQEAFVDTHVCATFLVDNDTGLLVTGFKRPLIVCILVAIIDKESLPLSLLDYC